MTNSNLPKAEFIHCSGTQSDNLGSNPLFNYIEEETRLALNIRRPSMPNSHAPSYDAWRQAIIKIDISQSSILLGHSLGASVLLKYLTEERPFLRLEALFLIAAPLWGLPDWTHGDYLLPDGFEKALANVKRIFLYHSTDDDIVPFHHSKAYSESLPWSSFRVLQREGHYFKRGLPVLVDDLKSLVCLVR